MNCKEPSLISIRFFTSLSALAKLIRLVTALIILALLFGFSSFAGARIENFNNLDEKTMNGENALLQTEATLENKIPITGTLNVLFIGNSFTEKQE